MKKLHFSTLAMAGLLFAACADKDAIVENGGSQGAILSDGYMALNISLPTASSSMSRAENDNFDDGDAAEYKVNNCALLFFDGSDEASATLIYANTFTDFADVSDNDNDNITTSYKIVTPISGHSETGTLYALAALNYDNVLEVGEDHKTVTLKNTAETPVTSLSDLYTAIEGIDLTGGGTSFFMTNAVLSTVPGGSGTDVQNPLTAEGHKIFQLAELSKANIYNTEAEAKNNPAGEVLVERAVAKATLSIASDANKIINEDESTEQNEVKLLFTTLTAEWVIDNVEPSTYVARKAGDDLSYIGYTSEGFETSPNYRFVSHTSTKGNTPLGTDKDYYRTYWCVDPQYNVPATLAKYYAAPPEEVSGETPTTPTDPINPIPSGRQFKECGTDKPLYCYENTFNVENQLYKNTTRAIIKVTVNLTEGDDQVKKGTTFYTVNGKYYAKADAAVQAFICNYGAVQNAVKKYLISGKTFDYNNLTEHIKVNFPENRNDDGSIQVTSLELKESAESILTNENSFKKENEESAYKAVKDLLEQPSDNKLIEDINAQLVILEYTEGIMYYEARFKHFAGNKDGTGDLAPWNTWEKDAGVTVPTATVPYPTNNKSAEENYLGRYGMVRNNWYDVEVTAFNKIGSPVIPDISTDPTPDDNLNEYISVKIHVLAWAKRSQKWEF